MRFDWYAATFQERPDALLQILSEGLQAEVKPTRGLHGYDRGFDLQGPSGPVARVLSGGVNEYPHAWASGEDTDRFVDLVRSTWPNLHTVSRIDAAEDFQGPGSWDLLNGECLTVADELRLKLSVSGDYHRQEDGRTLYVGSRKSAVYVRLYEKGKQLRARVTRGAEEIPDDWCRLEAQIRPQKEAKKLAAYVSPGDAWGFSRWTGELIKRCGGLDVPRVQMNVWREADDERALFFMVRQYGKMLSRLERNLGSWECVGLTLGEEVKRSAAGLS